MTFSLFRREAPAFVLLCFAVLLSGSAYAQGPIIVTDAFDRTVSLPVPPRRIVIAGPATLMIADALYLFESGPERLVGVTRIDQGEGNFLRAIDPRYAEKTILERQVGPEQILALRPDVVLLKTQVRRRLGRRLESMGVPVLYFSFESPEDYQSDLTTLATLLDEPQRGERLKRFFREERSRIADATQDASPRPGVLLVSLRLQGNQAVFTVPPAHWIQATLVRDAGGRPIWTDAPGGGWQSVTLEQIALWNPEVIFVVSYRHDAAHVRRRLQQNLAWSALSAVQNGSDFIVPRDYYSWDQPDVRWLLGLRWMAGMLHPGIFDDESLVAVIYRFFSELYDLSPKQIDDLILSRLTGEVDREGPS